MQQVIDVHRSVYNARSVYCVVRVINKLLLLSHHYFMKYKFKAKK